MFQAVKVWLLRRYYRFSSERAWRGQFSDAPYSTLQLPVSGAAVSARVYSSQQGAGLPLVVYFHGGGWVIGDLDTHHAFCQQLRRYSGCTVVAVNYRLAPEHPCPAAMVDCRAATEWLAGHLESPGPNNGTIVVAGDSAGAHLACCTALGAEPATRDRLAGALLLYPVADHYNAPYPSYTDRATGQALTSKLMRWFWDTWLAGQSVDTAAAAGAFPLRSAELAQLPATLLITAEYDPLRDEGLRLGERLRGAGVAVTSEHYPQAEHGFACSQGATTDFRHALGLISQWLGSLPRPGAGAGG